MKNTKRGFTLIELLVVVLIIGILAAIALPQYRKSVLRSKLTQLTAILDTAKKDRDMYVLKNGNDGETISKRGLRGELPLELLADKCEDNGWCHHKIGSYRLSTKEFEFKGNEQVGFAFYLYLIKEESSPWFVEKVDYWGDSVSGEIICSWIKDNGYPAKSDPYSKCKDSGVMLQQY